ncbi:restriction endonuclease subunit S [Acinetobacter sp. BSP-53]|uniref:restriction endonuclease subunit S n=1 Tax=Acinetobacter sp. BSP-53 TaxID=3344662 RepID=UPI00376F9873
MMFKQYDAYQDSNNLELPIVPVGWKVDRIKYEIKLLTGYPFNSSKYTEEGIKLVRGINVKESILDWKDTAYWPEVTPDLQRYLLKNGDLLIGMDGSKVGKNFCQVSEQDLPLLLLQRVARLRVKNLLNARYLYWNLASKRFLNWINRSKTDPMIPHMAPKDINDFVIAYPSTEEQSRIALFLDQKTSEIDQAIAIKEQQISLLNERKQIVIQKAVTQGLDPNVPMKDSGLNGVGNIPQDWHILKFKYLAKVRYGLGQPPKQLDNGLKIIRATNVERGKIVEKGMLYIDPNDIPWDRNPTLNKDEIIVVRSGAYTGDSAIVTEEYAGCIAGYDMVAAPFNCDPKFLSIVLLSHYVLYEQIYLLRMRSAQPHLNAEELNELQIVVPPINQQRLIANYIEQVESDLDQAISLTKRQIEKLKEYKTILINDAVTGKIKVA